jgi:hypothetical protein
MRRDNNNNNNNNPTTPRDLKLLDLPIPLLVHIFNNLGKTQEELMNLTLVSKQVNKICKNERSGIEWKIIPTFEISALQHEGGGSTQTLIKNMKTHSVKKFLRYRRMLVKDLHKFSNENNGTPWITAANAANKVQMDGITSLYMSSSYPVRFSDNNYLPRALAQMVPKLREVYLSNMHDINLILRDLSVKSPLLEKVTSNNNKNEGILLNGSVMRSFNNLKEIHMNNTSFYWSGSDDNIADLNNHQDIFLFHKCCKSLERVSIQNAKYSYPRIGKLSQNALIKFVRNAPPNLRWFRSDLSICNILMLRKERPGIELPFY